MIKQYHHTQTGYFTIIAVIIGMILVTYLMTISGFNWVAFAVLIVLAICLVLFPTLTVLIYPDLLEIRFGSGIIRKRFILKDIEFCEVVKNPFFYGWGIHLIPNGWLYNVSGFYAVEIRMRSGKKYRIGTDVPDDLVIAIRQSIERTN